MAKIVIKNTTLPDGTQGECGYISVTDETLILSDREFESGKKYTISFMAKANGTKTVNLLDGFTKTDITSTINITWTKVRMTFTGSGKVVGFTIPSGEYYLYQAQVSEGEIANTWEPSENDRDEERAEYLSLIELTQNSILLETKRASEKEGELASQLQLLPNQILLQVSQQYSEKAQSVSSVKVYYGVSDYDNVEPSQWSEVAPPWENGKFMWQKTVTTYANGTEVESDATNITGASGSSGVTVTAVSPLYYCSESDTMPAKPGNTHITLNDENTYNQWNIAIPKYTSTYKYYFTCTEIAYSDGNYSHSETTKATNISDVAEAKASIEVLADAIENKVSYGEQQNGWRLDRNGVKFTGNGDFIVDMTNLKVDQAGNVEVNGKIKSNSAEITGGSINIETNSQTEDKIRLLYRDTKTFVVPIIYDMTLSPSELTFNGARQHSSGYIDNYQSTYGTYNVEIASDIDTDTYHKNYATTLNDEGLYISNIIRTIVGSGEERVAEHFIHATTKELEIYNICKISEAGAVFNKPIYHNDKNISGIVENLIALGNIESSEGEHTVASNSAQSTRAITSKSLPKGHVYLVVGNVSFSGANTTGYRGCDLGNSGETISRRGDLRPAVNGYTTNCRVVRVFDCREASKLVYLNACQNSGATLSCWSALDYIVIG